MNLKKIFFVGIGGLFLLIIAGSIGVYSYSTQPRFCNSCHIMEPYYSAWKSSKHFGKAACVDCHYPPAASLKEHLWHKFQASAQVVKYVTRTYSSKPFADIPDASCLRSGCHSIRLLEGKVITASGIKFDHRPHLTETRRERKLRCVSCHSQIVVGTHVEVTYSTCFLCHFRPQKTDEESSRPSECLSCHQLPDKTFQLGTMAYNHKDFVTERGIACKNCHLEVVQGEGRVNPSRCLACHNQPEKLARIGDMPFLHENHVTKHHVACLHCHEEMRHGFPETTGHLPRLNEPQMPETPSLKGHPPAVAFNCAFCHKDKHAGQLEMYAGKVSALGLPEIPSPMYLANVDCIGCHYQEEMPPEEQEFRGHTVAASPQACVKCHGPAFEGILKQTRTILEETLTKLREKRLTLEQGLALAKKEAAETEPILGKIREAERLEQFVRISHGEHNIYLAAVALRKEDTTLGEAAVKAGIATADLSSLPLLSGGYCQTACHEKLGIKVPPETVTPFGKTMPHQAHTQMMSCVTCHDLAGHKNFPLKSEVRKEVCSGCHPE